MIGRSYTWRQHQPMAHPSLSRAPSVRLARVRDQVHGTFARVLARDPGVAITPSGDGVLGDSDIHFRDRVYRMSVNVTGTAVHVHVIKLGPDPDPEGRPDPFSIPEMFFTYTCALCRIGPLRKTALILYKKMLHCEIWEVMNC